MSERTGTRSASRHPRPASSPTHSSTALTGWRPEPLMTTVEVLRIALDIVETDHRRDIDGILRDAAWEAPLRRFGRPPTIQTRRRRAARKALTDTLKARGEYGVFPHHGID